MKCEKCHVPLKGIRGMIVKHIFGVKRSETHPHLCNKCAVKEPAKKEAPAKKRAGRKKKKGKR